jgi:hypothetical protein
MDFTTTSGLPVITNHCRFRYTNLYAPPMKRIILISAFAVGMVIATVPALHWFHQRSCYRNTLYSARYSSDAFARIAVGAPRASVFDALGTPLDADTKESYPVWALSDEQVRSRYSSVTNIAVEFLRFSQPKVRTHDFHWVQVSIGPDSTVIGTSSYITD